MQAQGDALCSAGTPCPAVGIESLVGDLSSLSLGKEKIPATHGDASSSSSVPPPPEGPAPAERGALPRACVVSGRSRSRRAWRVLREPRPGRCLRLGCGSMVTSSGSGARGERSTISYPHPRDMNSRLPNHTTVPRRNGRTGSAIRNLLGR